VEILDSKTCIYVYLISEIHQSLTFLRVYIINHGSKAIPLLLNDSILDVLLQRECRGA